MGSINDWSFSFVEIPDTEMILASVLEGSLNQDFDHRLHFEAIMQALIEFIVNSSSFVTPAATFV